MYRYVIVMGKNEKICKSKGEISGRPSDIYAKYLLLQTSCEIGKSRVKVSLAVVPNNMQKLTLESLLARPFTEFIRVT